ncbi:hypothetical protein [Sphingosinicella sp.]|uniref:hypothetical protein n=1 Tax=Sphingosinicella sp. TaxID=1917971 RepID=UPI0040376ABB
MTMMFGLVVAAFFNPTVPENIDVAEANWNNYPRLETPTLAIPNGEMVTRVQRLMQSGECSFEGQRPRRFSIDISYGVQLDSAGNATRIIVEDVGCRPLELMVGRIAADIVRRGWVRTAPPARPTIYANRINFNLS